MNRCGIFIVMIKSWSMKIIGNPYWKGVLLFVNNMIRFLWYVMNC